MNSIPFYQKLVESVYTNNGTEKMTLRKYFATHPEKAGNTKMCHYNLVEKPWSKDMRDSASVQYITF